MKVPDLTLLLEKGLGFIAYQKSTGEIVHKILLKTFVVVKTFCGIAICKSRTKMATRIGRGREVE